MTQTQKRKPVEVSITTSQESIRYIEGFAMKGLKVALILARLGDETSLVRMISGSELALTRGKNLLRGLGLMEDETVS